MGPIEKIFIIFVCFAIVLLIIGLICLIIKYLVLESIANFYIKRETNKLQWRCVETVLTNEARLAKKEPLNQYLLSYKVLDSELSTFCKMFGDNDWHYFMQAEQFTFESEDEFKKFVSNFKTYRDVKNYEELKDNIIIWYEP